MTPKTRFLESLGLCLLTLTMALGASATTGENILRSIEPATVVMVFPEAFGGPERPPVEFNHRLHTTSLTDKDCSTCHLIDDKGLTPEFKATIGIEDREHLVDTFHDSCMSCHRERSAAALASGPLTCGGCHVRRTPGLSQRLAMTFDYSLHGRHSMAFEDKCETCHHVYDEATQKLVYVKGKEDGCSSCHGAADEEKKLSLANASHRRCVTCHLKRIDEQLDSGPVLCVGCHAAEQRSTIRRLENIPRLKRGQPDVLWVSVPDGRSKLVPFNHLAHELTSQSCTECHHQSILKCSECHAIGNAPEGGGVILSRAFHMTSSSYSCVGCHRRQETAPECAGCHTSVSADVSERTCTVCHSGPAATALNDELLPPEINEVILEPLPGASDDFPDEVNIDVLVDAYEVSKLPHRKIVAKLDAAIRESNLARSFHVDADVMCAGCHHHSPPGSRPPQCRACHTRSAHPTRDIPGLKAAYHRQCIGCHQQMGIDKLGCTDCHAEREGQS